jgi:hypothetical protein
LEDVLIFNVRDGEVGGEWTLIGDTLPHMETIEFRPECYEEVGMTLHGRKVYQLLPVTKKAQATIAAVPEWKV